jgi:hypothetical protein
MAQGENVSVRRDFKGGGGGGARDAGTLQNSQIEETVILIFEARSQHQNKTNTKYLRIVEFF